MALMPRVCGAWMKLCWNEFRNIVEINYPNIRNIVYLDESNERFFGMMTEAAISIES